MEFGNTEYFHILFDLMKMKRPLIPDERQVAESIYKTKCALPHVIKLTILKWGDFPGFPEWAQCNLKLIRGGQKGQSERRRCDDGSRV